MNYPYNDSDIPMDRHRRFSISEVMGKIYKDIPQQTSQDRTKSLGEYIKFSNEGRPTRAEQLRRDRKLIEASGGDVEPEADQSQSAHGEVIGSVDDMPEAKRKKKGLEVSFINGQIVLDRSTLNRQVDRFDMDDSDDETLLSGLVEQTAKRRKHKVVVWSVEETRQFYDCLRRFGTDFFMMNKVITNRTRRDLKNKYKTEERRNPKLVSLILAVHLKEKMNVPDVPVASDTPTPTPIPSNSDKLDPMEIQPVPNTSEVPSLTEKDSRIEDDNSKDDEEVLGALSESEDELSEDDLLIDI